MAFELPFILYNNELENGVVSVSSEEAGFPKENMFDWLDWTYWKGGGASAPQYIELDKGGPGVVVDTFAVLGHNFGSAGTSIGLDIVIQEDDNDSFSHPTELLNETIWSDDPFYFAITSGTERYNKIRIGFNSGVDEQIFAAVIFLGKRMTIPVGPGFSFDPDLQNGKSEKYVNYNGRMVGSAAKYSERDMNVPFKRIPQSFVNSDILPFLEDHWQQMIPFFFVPDPGDVFGTGKVYYLVAPNDPRIKLPVNNDDISFRDWVLIAQGIRQSTFR